MIVDKPHITICICTFKRPGLLARLLARLDGLETGGLFTYSAVVADNDPIQSAQDIVAEFSSKGRVPVAYCSEPEKNIALARNAALGHAAGQFIAFIDDDEFPSPGWLRFAFQACLSYQAAGILGPVLPHFAHEIPEWIKRGQFFERPTYPTGHTMPWRESRTGNVLLNKGVLGSLNKPFRPEFGTGGEDVDFFRRVMEEGHKFYWCNEAVVFEEVPPSRCSRAYLLKRALLRGANSAKNPNRLRNAAKSMLAVPCYAVALPVLGLLGQHLFLTYMIRLCDHLARLLAFLGLRLVTQREL